MLKETFEIRRSRCKLLFQTRLKRNYMNQLKKLFEETILEYSTEESLSKYENWVTCYRWKKLNATKLPGFLKLLRLKADSLASADRIKKPKHKSLVNTLLEANPEIKKELALMNDAISEGPSDAEVLSDTSSSTTTYDTSSKSTIESSKAGSPAVISFMPKRSLSMLRSYSRDRSPTKTASPRSRSAVSSSVNESEVALSITPVDNESNKRSMTSPGNERHVPPQLPKPKSPTPSQTSDTTNSPIVFSLEGEIFPHLVLKAYEFHAKKEMLTPKPIEKIFEPIRDIAFRHFQHFQHKYERFMKKKAIKDAHQRQLYTAMIDTWDSKKYFKCSSPSSGGITVDWVQFSMIDDLKFVNEHTAVMSRGCHFVLVNPHSGHKETYKLKESIEGEKINCFCTDPCNSLIAYSGVNSFRIVIMKYPKMDKVVLLDDALKEDYIHLTFGGGDVIYALRGYPSFRLTIWNYKSIELLHTMNNAIITNDAFIVPNPFYSQCYLINTNVTSTVSKFTVHTFGETCTVDELDIDFDPPQKLCHGCFSPHKNVYFVDCLGNIYGVSKKLSLYMLFNWRIKICEVEVIGFPVKPFMPTFVQWYKKGLLVLGPSGFLRYFVMQSKKNNEKTVHYKWEIKECIINHLACNKSGDLAVVHSKEKGFHYIYNGSLSLIDDFSKFQVEHVGFLNPECKYVVTASGDSLQVWCRSTGQLIHTMYVKIQVGSIISHPNYPYIIITSSETGSFRAIDFRFVRKPHQLYDMWVSEELIPEIRFSPDGESMAVLTPEKLVLMFKAQPQVFSFEREYLLYIDIVSMLIFRAPTNHDYLNILTLDHRRKEKKGSHFTLHSFPVKYEGDFYCPDLYEKLVPCFSPAHAFFALTKDYTALHKIILDFSGTYLGYVKLASINLIHLLPSKPIVQSESSHLFIYGNDGLIYFTNDSNLRTFSVVMNHHRFDGGTKQVIVDKNCRHFLTLGNDRVLGCYTFPRRICGHRRHCKMKREYYIPLPYRRIRSLIPEYEGGLMAYEQWFKDMQVYNEIKINRIELSKISRDLVDLKCMFKELITLNDTLDVNRDQLSLTEMAINKCIVDEAFGSVLEINKSFILEALCNMTETHMKSFRLLKEFFWDSMDVHLFQVLAIKLNINCSGFVICATPIEFYTRRRLGIRKRIIDVEGVSEPPFIPWARSLEQLERILINEIEQMTSSELATAESSGPSKVSSQHEEVKEEEEKRVEDDDDYEDDDDDDDDDNVESDSDSDDADDKEYVEEEEGYEGYEEAEFVDEDTGDGLELHNIFDLLSISEHESVGSEEEEQELEEFEGEGELEEEGEIEAEAEEEVEEESIESPLLEVSGHRASSVYDFDSLIIRESVPIISLDENNELPERRESSEAGEFGNEPLSESLEKSDLSSKQKSPTPGSHKIIEFKIDPWRSARSKAKILRKILRILRAAKRRKKARRVTLPKFLKNALKSRCGNEFLSDILKRVVNKINASAGPPQTLQLSNAIISEQVERRLETLESAFVHYLESPLFESPSIIDSLSIIESNLILHYDSLTHVFKNIIYHLKESFNREMFTILMEKLGEIDFNNEKNAQIKELIEALRECCHVAPHLLPNVPLGIELRDSEMPELFLLSVRESEITATKILSREEEEALELEKERLKEAERLYNLDSWKREALMEMMDGVLELTWKEKLKRGIPIPTCVLEKNVKDFTEEEKEETKLYIENIIEFKNQCVHYAKLVQNDIKSILKETEDSHKEFNKRLSTLFELKHQVITAVCGERLKISRLSLRKASQSRIKDFLELIRNQLSEQFQLEKRLKRNIARIKCRAVKLSDKYYSFTKKDVRLRNNFRNLFDNDLKKAANYDKIMSLYQCRPPLSLTSKASSSELRQLAASQLDSAKAAYLVPQYKAYYQHIAVMSGESYRPSSIDKSTWELIVSHRKEKIILELDMEACKRDFESNKEVLNYFELLLHRIRHDFTVNNSHLMKAHGRLEELYKYSELQLVLPNGHLEIMKPLSDEFMEEAVLIEVSLIDDLNCILKHVATHKMGAAKGLKNVLDVAEDMEVEHILLRCYTTLMFKENKLIKKFGHPSYVPRYLNIFKRTGVEPVVDMEMTDTIKEEELIMMKEQRIESLRIEAKNRRTFAIKKQRLQVIKNHYLASQVSVLELAPIQMASAMDPLLDEDITPDDIILPDVVEVDLIELNQSNISRDKTPVNSEKQPSEILSIPEEVKETEEVPGVYQLTFLKPHSPIQKPEEEMEQMEVDSCLDLELGLPARTTTVVTIWKPSSTPSIPSPALSQSLSLTSTDNESEWSKEEELEEKSLIYLCESVHDIVLPDHLRDTKDLMLQYEDDYFFNDGTNEDVFLVPRLARDILDFKQDCYYMQGLDKLLKKYLRKKLIATLRNSYDNDELEADVYMPPYFDIVLETFDPFKPFQEHEILPIDQPAIDNIVDDIEYDLDQEPESDDTIIVTVSDNSDKVSKSEVSKKSVIEEESDATNLSDILDDAAYIKALKKRDHTKVHTKLVKKTEKAKPKFQLVTYMRPDNFKRIKRKRKWNKKNFNYLYTWHKRRINIKDKEYVYERLQDIAAILADDASYDPNISYYPQFHDLDLGGETWAKIKKDGLHLLKYLKCFHTLYFETSDEDEEPTNKINSELECYIDTLDLKSMDQESDEDGSDLCESLDNIVGIYDIITGEEGVDLDVPEAPSSSVTSSDKTQLRRFVKMDKENEGNEEKRKIKKQKEGSSKRDEDITGYDNLKDKEQEANELEESEETDSQTSSISNTNPNLKFLLRKLRKKQTAEDKAKIAAEQNKAFLDPNDVMELTEIFGAEISEELMNVFKSIEQKFESADELFIKLTQSDNLLSSMSKGQGTYGPLAVTPHIATYYDEAKKQIRLALKLCNKNILRTLLRKKMINDKKGESLHQIAFELVKLEKTKSGKMPLSERIVRFEFMKKISQLINLIEQNKTDLRILETELETLHIKNYPTIVRKEDVIYSY